MKNGWHRVGGSSGYCEKIYPNNKVGHVVRVQTLYQARYDGIFLMTCENEVFARDMVDTEHEMRNMNA
jgi:hypothetical protein